MSGNRLVQYLSFNEKQEVNMTLRKTQLLIASALLIVAAGTGQAGQRSAADQALYERAMKD